jgi:predicted RecB family nuclease
VHEQSRVLRSAARQRVLDYNEDDVVATARVRAWLRSS